MRGEGMSGAEDGETKLNPTGMEDKLQRNNGRAAPEVGGGYTGKRRRCTPAARGAAVEAIAGSQSVPELRGRRLLQRQWDGNRRRVVL